jgi:hypothetical protein
MSNLQHITIKDNGHLLAEADIQTHPDLVDAHLRVEAGHIPPGARSLLVDAVLDVPNVPPGWRSRFQPATPKCWRRSGIAATTSTPGSPA